MSERCPSARNYRHKILYVGADCALPRVLNDELGPLGCFVSRCPANAGWLARALLASDIGYALLLFDAELMDTTGIELAQLARSLPHRMGTRAVILSAGDCAEAVRVGADVFVREPEDGSKLAETIRQVLKDKLGN